MKKFKKPFKFYVIIFAILTLGVFAYSLYKIIKDSTPITELYSLWFLPLIFILIYYGGDSLLDKIFNKKKQIDYEALFVDAIAAKMRESNEFIIEDFRRLQINTKFQEVLKMGYLIQKNGETEQVNLDKVEKKFRKNTLEYRALKYMIEYLKETKKQ